LEKTTNATVTFLSELMQRGATAFQLFDSWAGLLTDTEYLEWCLPFHQRIFAGVDGLSILFVKEGPLDRMAQSGAKVVSLGTTHNLTKARREYPHLAFQGNVDHMLLVHGTLEEVSQATHQCLMEGNRDRHILNLDHGMDRNARVENFEAFINTAKN
jgi:uroporphyrinogen decarboxylase